MRTLFSASLLIFVFSAGIFAQSGRRIKPTPTPTPDASAEPNFSESIPLPKRQRIIPSFRSPEGVMQTEVYQRKPLGNEPDADADDPNAVLKVDTTLITIPVSVFDRNGVYKTGLEKHNFTIYEDGKPQEIAYFGTSDKPFTVVLLIDTSPSTDYNIKEIRAAATAFVDQLKPEDQVMVIEFDSNVHVLTEATGDREKIYKAISRADFGGGTSLYEAVNFSLAKRLNEMDGRKAIVLFTDGVDTTSRKASYDSTLDLAEESDSLVFPVYYNTFFNVNRGSLPSSIPILGRADPGTTAAEYAVGKKYLEDLAAYTGGRVFRPESTPGGLTRAFEGIAEELRRQYNIGYIPDEDGVPGQRKVIKVRVNQSGLVIRARDSYIVGQTRKNPPETK